MVLVDLFVLRVGENAPLECPEFGGACGDCGCVWTRYAGTEEVIYSISGWYDVSRM
jgi:hypothetical protein